MLIAKPIACIPFKKPVRIVDEPESENVVVRFDGDLQIAAESLLGVVHKNRQICADRVARDLFQLKYNFDVVGLFSSFHLEINCVVFQLVAEPFGNFLCRLLAVFFAYHFLGIVMKSTADSCSSMPLYSIRSTV